MAAEIIKLALIWLHCLHPSFVSLSLLIWFWFCFWVDFTADSVVPRGKFASTNQKHYPDLGSDTSSAWNFCTRSSDVNSRGNHWGVGCFLRLYYSGRVPGARPPLFFDQNEARRAEKSFLETAPRLYQGLDDRPTPPPSPLIWRSGFATDSCIYFSVNPCRKQSWTSPKSLKLPLQFVAHSFHQV